MSRKTIVLIAVLTTLAAAGPGVAALAQEDPPPASDDGARTAPSATADDADGQRRQSSPHSGEADSIELETAVIGAHRFRLTCMVTLNTGRTGACATAITHAGQPCQCTLGDGEGTQVQGRTAAAR